jgi:threonine dehydrogenase-like Zn-dependent dehydrogenase
MAVSAPGAEPSRSQLADWAESPLEVTGVSASLAEGKAGTRVLIRGSGPDGTVVAAFAVSVDEARRLTAETLPQVLALVEK